MAVVPDPAVNPDWHRKTEDRNFNRNWWMEDCFCAIFVPYTRTDS